MLSELVRVGMLHFNQGRRDTEREPVTFSLRHYCHSWVWKVATHAGGSHLKYLWRSMEKNFKLRNITGNFTVVTMSYVEILAIFSYLLWWGMTTERQERDHFLIGKLICFSALNNSIQNQCSAMWFSATNSLAHSNKEKHMIWSSLKLVYYFLSNVSFSSRIRIPVASAQKSRKNAVLLYSSIIISRVWI